MGDLKYRVKNYVFIYESKGVGGGVGGDRFYMNILKMCNWNKIEFYIRYSSKFYIVYFIVF